MNVARASLVCSLALAAACGSDPGGNGGPADAGTDVTEDSTGDAAIDTPAPDTGLDTDRPDIGPDTTELDADASLDTLDDADVTPDVDAAPDADATPDADTGADATPDADAGADASPDADASSDAGADATPDADAGTDADAGVACDELSPCAATDDPCQTVACVDGACVLEPVEDGVACDDGTVCTIGDVCLAGECTGEALACDDGDACNGVETCDAVEGCQPAEPPTCDDGDICNGIETCDAALGCIAGDPLACSDDDACNGVETCDPIAGCMDAPPPVCDPVICDTTIGCLPSCSDDLDCIEGYLCVTTTGRCEVPDIMIVAPEDDPALLGVADDIDSELPGLQMELEVVVTYATSGTITVTSSIIDGPPLAVVDAEPGLNIIALPFVPDGDQVIDVSLAVDGPRPLFANDTAAFTVDTVPPDMPGLTVELHNRRSGASTLTWAPVGDDGSVGFASRYEVVRAPAEIPDTAAFELATPVTGVDDDGTLEFRTAEIDELPWDAAEPSLRHTHWLAVRAVDDVGNVSAPSNTVTVTLEVFATTFAVDVGGLDDTARLRSVGDINGDGLSDIGLGNLFANYAGFVLGTETYPGEGEVAPVTTRTLANASGWFGYRASDPVDLNGDGWDDLVVGDHVYRSGGGAAFIYFGGPGGLPTSPSVTLRGAGGSDSYPGLIVNVGDFVQVGDERIDDIAITSESSWSVYVIAGRETWPATVGWSGDISANEAAGIVRIDRGAGFGEQLAALSDSDGDGFSEMAVLGPFRSGESTQIHVFDGGTISDLLGAGPDEVILDTPFPTTSTSDAMVGADVQGDARRELVFHAGSRPYVAVVSFDDGFDTPVVSTVTGNSPVNGFVGARVDLNDDGDADIAWVSAGELSVWIQRDEGLFRTVSGAFARSIAATTGVERSR